MGKWVPWIHGEVLTQKIRSITKWCAYFMGHNVEVLSPVCPPNQPPFIAVVLNKLLNKQLSPWCFETPWRSCYVIEKIESEAHSHQWPILLRKLTQVKLNCHWNSMAVYHLGKHTVNFLSMMASSNGNIFRVTGHLCGEFTGHPWIPRTKARDLMFSLIFTGVYAKFSGRLSEEPFPWLIQKFPCILLFKTGQPGRQLNLSEGQIRLDLTSGRPLV